MPRRRNWDGIERRAYLDDHDFIIAAGVKLDQHSKAIETLADNHETDLKEIRKELDWFKKIVYIGIGIGITINAIIPIVKFLFFSVAQE